MALDGCLGNVGTRNNSAVLGCLLMDFFRGNVSILVNGSLVVVEGFFRECDRLILMVS